MKSSDIQSEADALDAKAKELREQAAKLRHEELLGRPIADRLTYAAFVRCPCGHGMAYDPAAVGEGVFKGPSQWECAGVLLGTGDRKVSHQPPLPFAFYEIKSENQPSANGATTREFRPPVMQS